MDTGFDVHTLIVSRLPQDESPPPVKVKSVRMSKSAKKAAARAAAQAGECGIHTNSCQCSRIVVK